MAAKEGTNERRAIQAASLIDGLQVTGLAGGRGVIFDKGCIKITRVEVL